MRLQNNSTSLAKGGHFHLCGFSTDHIMCGFEIHNISFYSASRKSMGNPLKSVRTTSKNFCSITLLRVSYTDCTITFEWCSELFCGGGSGGGGRQELHFSVKNKIYHSLVCHIYILQSSMQNQPTIHISSIVIRTHSMHSGHKQLCIRKGFFDSINFGYLNFASLLHH